MFFPNTTLFFWGLPREQELGQFIIYMGTGSNYFGLDELGFKLCEILIITCGKYFILKMNDWITEWMHAYIHPYMHSYIHTMLHEEN